MNTEHYPEGTEGGKGGQFKPKNGAAGRAAKAKKKTPVKPKIQLAPEAMANMFSQLQDLSGAISVPLLNSAEDLEQNIEKFWTKRVISHVDKLYGNTNCYDKAQFHPKSNKDVNINMFTCIFGKYRYPDNHAHLVSQAEFDKLSQDKEHFTVVYRGFTSTGEKRANIIKGYTTANIDNLDIYGNGVYGTNVYTSTEYSYSLNNYANRDPRLVLHCLVDRDAKKCLSENITTELTSKFYSRYDYNTGKTKDSPLLASIKNKVAKHLVANGIDQTRAEEISNSFGEQLCNDISLYAILLGYDYQVSSSSKQRNILNLNKWYINKDKLGY